MEIKVHFEAGDGVKIESHTIPEFAGEVTSRQDKQSGTDITTSESDWVSSIVERLTVSERDGVWLSRSVEHVSVPDRPAPDDWRDVMRAACVVPASRMGDVRRVACDGETVWPEEAIEDKIDALEDAVRALS